MWRILVGFAVGAFIATIGYHRERKFEKFSLIAWLRSVVVASFYGTAAYAINLTALPAWATILIVVCFAAALERLTLEFYKTYVKADYKPHVICKFCHCNVLRVHGRYYRPKNKATRLENRLTSVTSC